MLLIYSQHFASVASYLCPFPFISKRYIQTFISVFLNQRFLKSDWVFDEIFLFLIEFFSPIPAIWNSSQCQNQSTARTSFHVLSETVKGWKLNSFFSNLMTKLLLVSVNKTVSQVISIYEQTNVTVQSTVILFKFKEHSNYRQL